MKVRISRRSGMTMTEVLVAGLVVAAALPPLMQLGVSIAKLDTGHGQRSLAIGLSQVAFEQIHYRLYNGDSRGGIKLNDTESARQTAYRITSRPAYLASFLDLKDDAGSPAIPADLLDPTQSPYLKGFINGYVSPGKSSPTALTVRTNPDLAAALAKFKIAVGVIPHLDIPTEDPGSNAWPRKKAPGEPKLDLARFEVRVIWEDAKGAAQTRTLVTRFGRTMFESDPLKSTGGR